MNIVVYPYSAEQSYIKAYRELFNYNIVRFMCCNGILPVNFENCANEICTFNDYSEGRIQSGDFETFCIIDKVPDENELYRIAEYMCSNGKDIICNEEEYLPQIRGICENYQVKLLEIDYETVKIAEKNWNNTSDILNIDVPIVAVMGIGQNVQKFNLQLYLRKNFINKGYKVSQIGTKKISALYGFHSLPDFLFNNEYSDIDKVYALNRMIKNISIEEKPDVILLGIPDSIIALNNKHRFSFGLYAYEMFNAVQPDFVITSLMANEDYNDDFYAEISEMAKYKYNVNIDAYFVSQFCPISNSVWSEKLTYGYLPHLKIPESRYMVYSAEDLKENSFFEQVERKLLLYGKYEQY